MMLFELTGSYEIMLPLMVACSTSVALAHWVLGGSMYTLKLRTRGIDPVTSQRRRALQDVRVDSAMTRTVATIALTATFTDVLERIRTTTHSAFPVVDGEGRVAGMLFLEDIRPLLGEDGLSQLALVADLVRRRPATVTATDSLEAARLRMQEERVSHLAVVDPESERLAGILSHRDILRAYEDSASHH
jgi:CIC family chloride channel protein